MSENNKAIKKTTDKVKTEMKKAVQGLDKAKVQHFPVIYTTTGQKKGHAKHLQRWSILG